MMTKDQFEELCAAYAIGALEKDGEAVLFSALDESNEEYKKIYLESIGVSYLINQALNKKTPSPLVKRDLLKNIFKGAKGSFSLMNLYDRLVLSLGFGNPRFGFVVFLLLAVVTAEVAIFGYVKYQEVDIRDNQIVVYETKINQLHKLGSLETELEKERMISNFLKSQKLAIVNLTSQTNNPETYGKVIWNSDRKTALLQFSHLPINASETVYQLWYQNTSGTTISACVFYILNEKNEYLNLLNIDIPEKNQIVTFSVTLEPKEGVMQPTGSVYLSGSSVE